MANTFSIAVLAGDGVGPEVIEPCLSLLEDVQAVSQGALTLQFHHVAAGAENYRRTGVSIAPAALEVAQDADAILLAAMGLPEVRYPDGTEIAPQLELRERLGLYAGMRPVRVLPGLPTVLADPRARDLDFVIVRESTEGLFAARGRTELEDDRVARDTMVISRAVCEKLFDFALALGVHRKRDGFAGRVTCVDKANVLGSFAFFRSIFDERASRVDGVTADHAYVDATGLNMLKQPWTFDVLVTENMFGDILSDVGAALMGGMGFAPSADIGDRHAVFQPCHGSAPDIVGQGKANPTAMFLSAAMMLDWLGVEHGCASARAGAARIRGAVDAAYRDGNLLPYELGGAAGTRDIADAVFAAASSAADTAAPA